MKQGRASRNVFESSHVNPNNKSVNPAAADQLGRALGNKAMDCPDILPGAKVPLYRAESGRAPMTSVTIHNRGSQGRR